MGVNMNQLIAQYANLEITKKQFYKTINNQSNGWELYRDFQKHILALMAVL